MQLIKRIALPVALLVFVAAVVIGSTGAFFSDTETSTGNTFTAGAIDLQIDNHAWYNGNECAYDDVDQRYEWVGSASYPVPGTECSGTWEPSDLGPGHLFFDLQDLKPGDWEEDTISLHVNNNDAWMCANLTITSNDDISSTEPELSESGEVVEDNGNLWDGELASELNFIFWADDGDNVLEDDENIVLSGTPADLPQGDNNGGQTFPIADAYYSIFDGPIPGDETVWIGKAFCYGSLTVDEVTQDGDAETNSPAIDPGFDCSGHSVTNISQTDGITANMEFSAVQSRNNENFSCLPI